MQGVVDSMLRTHGLLREVLARRFINDDDDDDDDDENDNKNNNEKKKKKNKTIILIIIVRIRRTPQTRFTGPQGRITASRNAPGPHLGRKNARIPPCEEWGGRRGNY